MLRARQRSVAPPASTWPATSICPCVGATSPAASASQVDLPEPDGPLSSNTPPCGTFTSSKRSVAPPAYA